MTDEVELAYRHCSQVAKEQARNFYFAFITLPARKKRAIYAAYAFCRLCDDIADDDLPVEVKIEKLAETRKGLEECYAGRPQDPVFVALGDASQAFNIPQEYFEDIVRGVEMDLTWNRYRDFEELRSYCYNVASAVGLICIKVFGYDDPRAREYAIDLGLAMQLTNILRDIKEDANRGRIYIPMDEMERFGYSEEELINGVTSGPFKELMAFQVQRARRFFQSGRRLIPLLPMRSRACPIILAGIYSRLLDRIEAQGFQVFNGRISLSAREKVFLATKSWIESLIPAPPILRKP